MKIKEKIILGIRGIIEDLVPIPADECCSDRRGDREAAISFCELISQRAVERAVKDAHSQNHCGVCNHPHQPIGGPGCICVVTYRKRMKELLAAERALNGGTP